MDLNKIYELVVKIDEKVDKLSVSQAKSEVNVESLKEHATEIRSDLNYHIKRTDLLEREVTKVRGFFFYLSLIVGAVGAIAAISSNLGFFK